MCGSCSFRRTGWEAFELMEKVKIKTITYSPNNGEPEENSGFDPFYGGSGDNLIPFPRDRITPWYNEETRKSPEGIMSTLVAQMSELETKKYLGGFLIPYGFKEEEILKMPLKEIE